MITVADTEVYYTFYHIDNPYGEKEKVNKATFAIDRNLYEVQSVTLSKENLLKYVEDFLRK